VGIGAVTNMDGGKGCVSAAREELVMLRQEHVMDHTEERVVIALMLMEIPEAIQ